VTLGYPPQHLGIVCKSNWSSVPRDCQDIAGAERSLTKHNLGGLAGHDSIKRNEVVLASGLNTRARRVFGDVH
jgi:hypothetical protein